MTEEIKLFSFIVALKRHRKNSVILSKPKYILSKHFGIHTTTFSRYLNGCIRKGWIEVSGGRYVVIPFEKIIKDFCNETQIGFGSHDILCNKETDFKKVYESILDCGVIDNIILRQSKIIKVKNDLNDLHRRLNLTGKLKLSYDEYKKYRKMVKKLSVNEAKNVEQEIVTSARHCGSLLGISTSKANKLLNKDIFGRKIKTEYHNECNIFIFEKLRALYPKAIVIPMPFIGVTKVCFGSSIDLYL